VSLPIQVVGGLSVDDCRRAFEAGAHSVAIGSPIVPGESDGLMIDQLGRIVEHAAAVG